MRYNPDPSRVRLALVFLFMASILMISSIGTVAAQWTGDTRVTSLTVNNESRWANTVIDSQGNVHIAFNEDPPNGEIWYTKLDRNGNVLIPEKQVTASDGTRSKCPVLGVDSNDNIHITYCDYQNGHWEPYHIKLDNNGTPLTTETRLGFAQTGDSRNISTWPTNSIDSNDFINVVWAASPNGNTTPYQTEIYYSKLYNNGTILVNKTRLTNTASHKYHAVIAVDSNGDFHIAWRDRMVVDGPEEIFYTKVDYYGNTLVEPKQLTFTPTVSSRRPWITIDSDDNVNIVWTEGVPEASGTTEYSYLYYMKLDNNGNKIINDTRLTPLSTRVYSLITASPMDAENNIHLTWNSNRPGIGTQIFYMKINNTGGIVIDETQLTSYISLKDGGIHTSLGRKTGDVFVTWADSRDRDNGGGNSEVYYKKARLAAINYDIPLQTGWNLISLPLVPDDKRLSAVLAPIAGNYNVVLAWKGTPRAWNTSTARRGALTTMTVDYGYWIDMKAPDVLKVSGTVPSPTTLSVIQGWNLVGYPSGTTQSLTSVLTPINYNVVLAWKPDRSGVLSWNTSTARRGPLTTMDPGYGYWIDSNGVGSYVVTY